MGKDKKKDKKKQGKGAERTAAKTAKNAAKREKKERAKTGEPAEEDIESILAELALQDKQRVAVSEAPCGRPSPRVHASFLAHPAKDREYLVFGGEYYNGERVHVYNDLFRLKEQRGELTWTQISSPNTPKPRSSHQAVASRAHMYVIGGEFTSPSQMQFYHHRDMWRLDLDTSKWEEVRPPHPSAPLPAPGAYQCACWGALRTVCAVLRAVRGRVHECTCAWAEMHVRAPCARAVANVKPCIRGRAPFARAGLDTRRPHAAKRPPRGPVAQQHFCLWGLLRHGARRAVPQRRLLV